MAKAGSGRGTDVPESQAEAKARVHDRLARTETEVHAAGSGKSGALPTGGPRGAGERGHGGGGGRRSRSGGGYKGGGRGR
jgi:hypothetical protein